MDLNYIKKILEKRVETLNEQKTVFENQGLLENIVNVEAEITETDATLVQINNLINE